jgi:hypothetical protein
VVVPKLRPSTSLSLDFSHIDVKQTGVDLIKVPDLNVELKVARSPGTVLLMDSSLEDMPDTHDLNKLIVVEKPSITGLRGATVTTRAAEPERSSGTANSMSPWRSR